MKFKKIMIIAFLIFAVLTVSAVSASDDMASDDNLTVETEIDDSILESDDSILESDDSNLEEDIVSSDGSNDDIVGVDYDLSQINCDIYTDLLLDDEEGVVVFTSTDSKATGDLIIYIEGVQRLVKTIKYSDYKMDSGNLVYQLNIKPYDLKINSEGRFDNWKVTFNGETVAEADEVYIHPYTFYFEDEWGDDLDDGYYGYGETINLHLRVPNDATARLTVTINKKTYTVTYKNGEGMVPIDTKGWALGNYEVSAKYYGDNKYLQREINDMLVIRPNVECPVVMASGENEQIKVSAPSGLSGEVKLRVLMLDEINNIYKQISINDLTFRNGVASYSLSSLAAGDYIFYVDYKIGTYQETDMEFDTVIVKNTAGISSTISPTSITQGQYVTVKVNGPKFDSAEVQIYINDKLYRTTSFKTGSLTEVLTDLPVGTVKVNVYIDYEENGKEYFHSNTKRITVNAKSSSTPTSTPTTTPTTKTPTPAKITLTLKTVKVKKSAKKIVLQVTLKQGNPLKGKKVTFKFNGKKYTAKTNKNGIAKVTIKKNVLKKLKVGKKIKYTATYNKVTVSKTVKVKK